MQTHDAFPNQCCIHSTKKHLRCALFRMLFPVNNQLTHARVSCAAIPQVDVCCTCVRIKGGLIHVTTCDSPDHYIYQQHYSLLTQTQIQLDVLLYKTFSEQFCNQLYSS